MRLQLLILELLSENQALRLRVAELEQSGPRWWACAGHGGAEGGPLIP